MKQQPLILFFLCSVLLLTAQLPNSWTPIASQSGTSNPAAYAASFVVDGKMYVATGTYNNSYSDELYNYNPTTGTWTDFGALPDLPATGANRRDAIGFTIGNKGYVGAGHNGTGQKDFFSYTTGSLWSTNGQVTDIPVSISNGVSFVIGNKAYVGSGLTQATTGRTNQMFVYDSTSNTWSAIASLPGPPRSNAVAFVLNGDGYVGLGMSDNVALNDFWKYDTANNVWSQVAQFTGTARHSAIAFAIGDCAYVGLGENFASDTVYGDLYRFSLSSNGQWDPMSALPPGQQRGGAACQVINDTAYVAGGRNGSTILATAYKYNPPACLPVGLTGDLTAKSAFAMYPNPVNETLTLTNLIPGTALQVTNVLGELLIKDFSEGTTKIIDLSQLPTGMYFINNKKFVKQ